MCIVYVNLEAERVLEIFVLQQEKGRGKFQVMPLIILDLYATYCAVADAIISSANGFFIQIPSLFFWFDSTLAEAFSIYYIYVVIDGDER